uniref:Regulatory protein SIR2 homolog 7 n=2 Tax=Hirondellea gigas TaxID=1518452 RepID=A0A6A7G4B6_9CRUS
MAGFAVDLKMDCPHVDQCVENVAVIVADDDSLKKNCASCLDTTENWLCLSCFSVRCSRYVAGHMQDHYEETKENDVNDIGHAIVLSFSDISVWCNVCESYVGSNRLKPYINAAYAAKFGEDQTNSQDTPFVEPKRVNPTSGASTAHKSEAEYVEHFDSPEVFQQKIKQLAQWVKDSKHMIAFTGAGVSTSTGIPDFRSGLNTVLETGAGAWTLSAAKKSRSSKAKVKSTLQALPSKTHMALVQLERDGILKHLISQNCDGLHRRSGIPPHSLSELHGNTNLEICVKCEKEYMRDHHTRNAIHYLDHRTGRMCTVKGCQGALKDTIINFTENLPEKPLEDSESHSKKADLCLAMGSSLRVTPAALMPEEVGRSRSGRLVIVNLQSTPLDHIATLRINALCDNVMVALMKELDTEIPEFRLLRFIRLQRNSSGKKIGISAVDSDDTPLSLFTEVELNGKTQTKEPFIFKVNPKSVNLNVDIRLHFVGNYNEPPLEFSRTVRADDCLTLSTKFNPMNGQWTNPSSNSEMDLSEEKDLVVNDTEGSESSHSPLSNPNPEGVIDGSKSDADQSQNVNEPKPDLTPKRRKRKPKKRSSTG